MYTKRKKCWRKGKHKTQIEKNKMDFVKGSKINSSDIIE